MRHDEVVGTPPGHFEIVKNLTLVDTLAFDNHTQAHVTKTSDNELAFNSLVF